MIRAPGRAPTQPRPLSIRTFKGVDETGTRDLSRASEMVNCILDDEGTPEMRTGWEPVFPTSLGAGAILGIHKWRTPSGGTIRIIHHGTKLYTCATLGVQPTEVYSGMSGLRHSTSFELGTKLGIIDGTAFVVFDGTTVVTAESIAYTPTRYINRTPTGSTSNLVEDFNLIQPKWKEFFTTVAGTSTYQLSEGTLDSISSVKLNGVTFTNPTNYTVNLTTGLITLVANPGTGAYTNNLEVVPSKVRSGYADRIKKCTVAAAYGGPNDSKIFLGGNPDYPHVDFWTGFPYATGAYDLTYWPDTYTDRVGGDNDPIVGYAIQYDYMVIIKRNSAFKRTYSIEQDAYGRTVTRFPSVPLNDYAGCVEADSIQMVKNDPWFLSDDGVYAVVGTSVRDQNDVEKRSPLIRINQGDYGVAIMVDDKYYLATGDDEVWVADVERSIKDEDTGKYGPVWYKWTNMPVSYWCSEGTNLLFGSNVEGQVYRMKDKVDDVMPYNDNGVAISPCYWTMVNSTMDRDDMTKLVLSLIITEKPFSQANMGIQYETEEGWFDVSSDTDLSLAFMDYGNINYAAWSYLTTNNPQSFKVRIDNARGIQRFRLRIRSTDEVDVFMGFASIDINFQYLSGVR